MKAVDVGRVDRYVDDVDCFAVRRRECNMTGTTLKSEGKVSPAAKV